MEISRKQKEFLDLLEDKGLTELLIGGSAGGPLTKETKVATPIGFISIGNLDIGDEILGIDGQVERVIDIPYEGEDYCYKLTYIGENGLEDVVASYKHKWRIKQAYGLITTKDIFYRTLNGEHTTFVESFCRPPRDLIRIEGVGSRPVKCISTSAEDGMFLIGDYLPTHNSKTMCMGMGIVLFSRKYPGARFFVGRKTLKSLKQSTINTLLTKVHPLMGVQDSDYAMHFQDMTLDYANGSKIIFGELETQPSDPDFSRVGSLEIDFAFVDEAGEITLEAKNAIKSRVGRGIITSQYGIPGKIILSANPSSNFLRGEYYDNFAKLGGGGFQKWQIGEVTLNENTPEEYKIPAYRGFLRMGAYDNPFLPQSYIDNLKTLPDRQRKRLLDGNWDYLDEDDMLFKSGLIDKAMVYDLPSSEKFNKFIGVDLADKGKDRSVYTLIDNGVVVAQKVSQVKTDWEEHSDKPLGMLVTDELIEFAQKNGFTPKDAKRIAIECNGVGTSCLPMGELVLTSEGEKAIQDIEKGELVIDNLGHLTKVLDTMEYNYNGEIYDIQPFCWFDGWKFTEEHPILVSQNSQTITYDGGGKNIKHNFGFVPAGHVKRGDWLKVPVRYNEERELPDFSRFDYASKPSRYAKLHKDIEFNKIIRDKEFWWLVGLWLGDGWLQNLTKKPEVHIAYNPKQPYLQRKVERIAKRLFIRKATSYDKPFSLNSVIRCLSLGRFLKQEFGEYSYYKKLPEWVKYAPKVYRRALLAGYWCADGTIGVYRDHGKNFLRMGVSTSSIKLVKDIQDMLFSLGVCSGVSIRHGGREHMIRGKIVNTRDNYCLRLCSQQDCLDLLAQIPVLDTPKLQIDLSKIDKTKHNVEFNKVYVDDGFIYLRVKQVSHQKMKKVKVFNLETESHTFNCRLIGTHNCRDILKMRGWYITEYIATHKSRSENYYQLMLDMDSGDLKIYHELYGLDELRKELAGHTYTMQNQVPSVCKKDDIKLRIGRSPDLADSLEIANYVRNQISNPQLDPRRNANRILF